MRFEVGFVSRNEIGRLDEIIRNNVYRGSGIGQWGTSQPTKILSFLSVATEAQSLHFWLYSTPLSLVPSAFPGNATARCSTSLVVQHLSVETKCGNSTVTDTLILPMNVLDIARTAGGPPQLSVGADKWMRRYVIPGGVWGLQGIMLWYDNLYTGTGELARRLCAFLAP